jgi:HEAT repeat protein
MPALLASLPLSGLTAALVLACIALGFLAARVARRLARRDARLRRRELESLMRDCLAEGRGGRALRGAARECDPELFWSTAEALAFEGRPDRRRLLGELLQRNPHVAAERRALRDDSPWRRELACRRLALLPAPASRRALRRALVRGPELVTLAAATALARYRDRAALRWVLARSRTLARRTPRALIAMLRGFGRRALGDIAAALERGVGDPRLERALIDTLGLARYLPACAAIVERLAAEDVDLRVAAARALGRLEAAPAAPRLFALLDDPRWEVRAQSARALGRIGAREAVPALAARLTDRAWWVRHHAAYALAALGEDGRRALREIAADSPDPFARDMAGEVLAGGFTRPAA